jgi:two-component system KDP operon response regulator KdpE
LRAKILVIEDENDIATLVRYKLQQEGYQVLSACDGVEGLEVLQEQHPHVILLDVMMPRMNGWEACRKIRECSDAPIIMLTGLGAEQDKVRGLEMGADDYVTKPFSMAELSARVGAALRRSRYPLVKNLAKQMDDRLVVDRARRLVFVDGQRVDLSPTEYRILCCFLDNADRVLTHQWLLTEVWGWQYADETDYLRVYVHHLRKKIEENPRAPRYILTEHGMGYRFQHS